ncbi:MAG: response regulator, partial [Sulfuritalea sp.]|nr:response regulator [Sulfuritalea sp.]
RGLGADVARWRKAWGRTARDGRTLRRAQEKHGGAAGDKALPVFDKLLDAIERDELAAKAFAERLAALERLAEQERRALAGMVDGLQGDMRQALMLPFASLLELLPKLVRDLARDSGKQVELHIEGAALEIDRRILEQMKDPLIHLIRNAIDHGIETAEARRSACKPLAGRIAIGIAAKAGNRVELTVADDGAGVDLEKLKAAARKLGLIAAEGAAEGVAGELAEELAGLGGDTALALMFESGLTTSPILTDLSGRGLGLAIVREKVEKLGGSVAAELPAAGGTLFRIVLPTALATFRGLLVGLGERQFVLPSRSVERVLRMPAANVKTVENRAAVEIGGQAVALVRLADALGLPGLGANVASGADLQLAVLEASGRRIAFAVDAILGTQEVLVKNLGPQLRRVPNIAGATVLGPGRVVPILNVADLLKSAQRVRPQAAVAPAPTLAQRQHALLVVEDSITARSLLKNILESAGYRVETAVDGIDAMTALRSGQFDLVVSDVEMPRMDGFELTARIRADKKLAELPVVLVTALESREHKERGIEVGANAYIVKSSFDQSNLFAVIRRLL